MNRLLRVKIEDILGPICQISILNEQGATSEVCKILTGRASYIIKTAFDERYRAWLKNEASVLEKLNNLNLIPVPHFWGFIEGDAQSHLIMSFEDGITLTSALQQAKNKEKKKALIKSFGHLLQLLHETVPIARLNHNKNWINERLAEAEMYAKRGQTEGSQQLLGKLKSHRPHPVKQTIIHGDCTPDNVLVSGGEVRVFIDVAGMTVGDPRYDEVLAISCFEEDDEYINAFYQGYTRYRVSRDEYQYFQRLYEFF